MESQWKNKNIKPSKINVILLILGMLSFICLSHLVWSAYLTIEVEKIQNGMIDNQPNNFSENVPESLKSLQVSTKTELNLDNQLAKKATENKIKSSEKSFLHALAKRSVEVSKQNLRDGRKQNQPHRNHLRRRQLRQKRVMAIHIEADPRTQTAKSTGIPVTSPLRNWKVADLNVIQTFGTSHLRSRGYVTVPQSGFYYIYSQVVFTKTPRNYVSAAIGVGYWGRVPYTKCFITQGKSESISTTCHASGIKYLEKGKGISILIYPNQAYVRLDPKFTYFGAYMLG